MGRKMIKELYGVQIEYIGNDPKKYHDYSEIKYTKTRETAMEILRATLNLLEKEGFECSQDNSPYNYYCRHENQIDKVYVSLIEGEPE